MKKLSESVWGDLRKKSLGQEERIEDKIGNLKDLSPVDMGESSGVLWADTDLILNDGTYKFTYEEAEILQKKISELPNKSLSEWRLPTHDETEIIRNFILKKSYAYDNEKITISSSQNELIFLRRFDDGYQSWAVDKPNCPCMNLEIDEHFHPGVILHTTIMTGRNSRKACIRLVKSK